MKKHFISLLTLAMLVAMSSGITACSDDDDDDNPKQEQTTSPETKTEAETAAAATATAVTEVAAAVTSPDQTVSESTIKEIADDIAEYKNGTAEYKEAYEKAMTEATGLSTESVEKLLNTDETSTESIKAAIEDIAKSEPEAVKEKIEAYRNGQSDAADLAQTYAKIASGKASQDELEESLNTLSNDIKTHYQTSDDAVYKQVYLDATTQATGLDQNVVKLILEAQDPKAAMINLLGTTQGNELNADGFATVAAATQSGTEAATMLSDLKTQYKEKVADDPAAMQTFVSEVLQDGNTVQQIKNYVELYDNSSEDAKQAFVSGAVEAGVPQSTVNSIISSGGDSTQLLMALSTYLMS